MAKPRDVDERGAATLEMALVAGLLLMLVLGSFEWGMALRDWMTVSSATREGARAASSAGSLPEADCRALEAVASALQEIPSEDIAEVWIYLTDPSGTVRALQQFRPKQDTDDPVALECGAAWFKVLNGWPPAIRNDAERNRDWLGVRVVFDHTWKTNFLWFSGTVRWSEDTVMRIEPRP
ncbi:MAG: pilus assembly protein [Acidimicrobiia bacterium]|nr:pilus assembly protein [Acidimicrobiia bacterium]